MDFICSQLGNISSPIGEYSFHGWGTNIPQLGANKIYGRKGIILACEKIKTQLYNT